MEEYLSPIRTQFPLDHYPPVPFGCLSLGKGRLPHDGQWYEEESDHISVLRIVNFQVVHFS